MRGGEGERERGEGEREEDEKEGYNSHLKAWMALLRLSW